jgi:hypothetical protein
MVFPAQKMKGYRLAVRVREGLLKPRRRLHMNQEIACMKAPAAYEEAEIVETPELRVCALV